MDIDGPAERLAEAVRNRLHHLGWGISDWKRASGVSDRTLREIRDGLKEQWSIRIERPAERSLGWTMGTFDAIRDGLDDGVTLNDPDPDDPPGGAALLAAARGNGDELSNAELRRAIDAATAILERRAAARDV